MTKTLITITDVLDNAIRQYDMGSVLIDDESITFPFRVWNNLRGLKKGIATATSLKLNLLVEPLPNMKALQGTVQGRCVFSGEEGNSVVDQFHPFPMDNTEYDELKSGQYNEYEVKVVLWEWPVARNFLIEDLLSTIYIVAEVDR